MNVSSDIRVKFLEKEASYYLNKSTILFGASDSGKSTILIEILYLLKEHVPNIFVFAPTADSNNAFTDIVPSHLIYKEVNIDILNAIYNRQQAATKMYHTVNDIQVLKKLYNMVANEKSQHAEKVIIDEASDLVRRKREHMDHGTEHKQDITEINKSRDKYLMKLYKSMIRGHKKYLRTKMLTDKEKYIIKYLDFNPYCVVVFDDCGAELKKFQKEEVVKKIIFQGRHSCINLILTLQDDIGLDSAIKKNSFVNIFTTKQCATAYFQRGSNHFAPTEKLKAEKIINHIFSPIAGKKNFKKLVYLRNDPDPFRYTVADIYDKFRFGCETLWKLCMRLDKDRQICDFENDPLLSAFKIDL
jgi:hypothetical protein